MAKKDTFLLVSLNEDKAKEVAQIITNKTCRKVLDFLAGNSDVTESQVAKSLKLPISTVHYNLEALKKAKLVESEEFHYSAKGKEVSHYKLANKYIIIAPKSTWGMKEKLRSILPVGLLAAAAAVFIAFFQKGGLAVSRKIGPSFQYATEEVAAGALGTADKAIPQEALAIAPDAVEAVQPLWHSWVFWFVLGAVFAITLYLFIEYIRKRR